MSDVLHLRSLKRLAQMTPVEAAFRLRECLWRATERLAFTVRAPCWSRIRLLGALDSALPALEPVRTRLRERDWMGAHRELVRYFVARDCRFVLDPRRRDQLCRAVREDFPAAPDLAARRADRVLEGRYDLLGHRNLQFAFDLPLAPRSAPAPVCPDWHLDPVHRRRPPLDFWSRVPFLHPACGDHKVIWELNRHQHWLALGRAAWLTGAPRYHQCFARQLASWMAANPPRTGANWASMLELGLRCISWIWALHFFAGFEAKLRPDAATEPIEVAPRTETNGDQSWLVDLLLGIDAQLMHISRHLSRYFSPNTHLLGEGLALYVGGRSLPELARARHYEGIGRALLLAEIGAQILPDGGHAELSPHYHRYALDFYLLAHAVARITGDPAEHPFGQAVERLARFARTIADSRGRLPLIGDDDGGVLFPICGRPCDDVSDSLALAAISLNRPELSHLSSAPEEVYWLFGERPHERLRKVMEDHGRSRKATEGQGKSREITDHHGTLFPDSGYAVSRSDEGDLLVMDVGRHGFLNGGHAHADALSLILTLSDKRFLIDSGTGTYTMDSELRDRLRSTAMHNTVIVDGLSQSIPDGPFHWARRADARVRCWRSNRGFDYLEASHDAYAPLTHHRSLLALRDGCWFVLDMVTGPGGSACGPHRADIHWHVEPGWRAQPQACAVHFRQAADGAYLASSAPSMQLFHADPGSGLGWHAPIYGRLVPCTTARVTEVGPLPLVVATVIEKAAAPMTRPAAVEVVQAAIDERGEGCVAVRVRGPAGQRLMLLAVGRNNRPSAMAIPDGILETDARLLHVELLEDDALASLTMVEGSYARVIGPAGWTLELPRLVSDLHVRLRGSNLPPEASGDGIHGLRLRRARRGSASRTQLNGTPVAACPANSSERRP